MTRWFALALIAIHAGATLWSTLSARRRYTPMRHMLDPWRQTMLQWGWLLVGYDVALALLVSL